MTKARTERPVASEARRSEAAKRRSLAVCSLLLLGIALVFAQTLRHGFAHYDDPEYVCKNPQVAGGLTVQGIVWAVTSRHENNWHPLSWLSHMFDCQLYGLAPWGHHLSNILLHAATAIAFLLVLERMTGDFWPSALVAALFAIHPLRVESVAWVAERKDVLSGLLFMLTLGAYLGYVRRPFSLARYLSVIVVFALGLMAKPMLVTLPFALLLLDYWPLRRMTSSAASTGSKTGSEIALRALPRLLVEKIPLFALSAASCTATLWAQHELVARNEHIAMPIRLGNAAISYVAYLGQSFYPVDLAALYPHPVSHLAAWKWIGAVVVLAALSAGAVAGRRTCPYLLVGWLWYLGMLLPVIGLVPVGAQAMADRYTYLPQIGLGIALVWGATQVARSWPYRLWVCGTASAAVLTALLPRAWHQASYWRDTAALWEHTVTCTTDNYIAHNNLGVALAERERVDEAIAQFTKSLQIKPNYSHARGNLGLVLAKHERPNEAKAQFEAAVKCDPDYLDAHKSLALILTRQGQLDEAIEHYRQALRIRPDDANLHNALGGLLARQRQTDDAILHYRAALNLKPDYAEACYNLGILLQSQGRIEEALQQYEKAVEIDPKHGGAHNNLGAILGQKGRLTEAIRHFRSALEINPDDERARQNLEFALRQQ